MARMTCRRAMMEMLKAEGVEYIFGSPGTSETPIMDELESLPELKYVLVMQEGVAMGMADAYARVTCRPSFVNLHIETGLANGISLLHNASEGGTPLVLSFANLDIRELARGWTDLAEMVQLFTKFTAEVTHPEQVPTIMRRAFNEAKTPPTGPTFMAFSANALDHEGEMDIFPSPKGYFRTSPDPGVVEDAGGVGSTQPTDVGIVADPKVALESLAVELEASISGSARETAKGRAVTLASEKAAREALGEQRLKDRWNMSPMSADRMMAEIALVLPEDNIIVNDAVTSGPSLFHSLDFAEPGSIYGGRGGALGWGMGGAMGVKLANHDRPVVAGDGSAMMTVQGLWTAANEDIPVVCNNSTYRVLKLNMNLYKTHIAKDDAPSSRYLGMDFPLRPNFADMAEAMGVHGRRIEDPAELGPAMRHALSLDKPALLDVIIDGSV